jgi:hypothetical protein
LNYGDHAIGHECTLLKKGQKEEAEIENNDGLVGKNGPCLTYFEDGRGSLGTESSKVWATEAWQLVSPSQRAIEHPKRR